MHLLARLGRPPNADRVVALQHHVVAEDMRQVHVGDGVLDQTECGNCTRESNDSRDSLNARHVESSKVGGMAGSDHGTETGASCPVRVNWLFVGPSTAS